MPSNDERRQVAARLREHAKTARRVGYACVLKNCTSEEECDGFGIEGCEGCFNKSLTRLAELIEPEPERTCRVERRHVGPLYNVYKFSCCEEEWAESNTDQHASAIDETVCPRCGAKVIE